MKKVFQSSTDKLTGDCFRASLASLFELRLEQVPHFVLYPKYEYEIAQIYFLMGLGYDYVADIKMREGLHPSQYPSVGGYYEATVPSKTHGGNILHSVVIDKDGVVVHDPNPNGLWLGINVVETGDLKGWMHLERWQRTFTLNGLPTCIFGSFVTFEQLQLLAGYEEYDNVYVELEDVSGHVWTLRPEQYDFARSNITVTVGLKSHECS